MIEAGLVALINADAGVQAITTTGGYLSELPPNATLPSWTHSVISEPVDYLLTGPDTLVKRRVQIDAYSQSPDTCLTLSYAIEQVLSGYSGTLQDTAATVVALVAKDNMTDFFDDDARNYRRSVDYFVFYYKQ
jgi:hypothetical protein